MTNSNLIKKIQSPFMQKGRQEIRTGMEVEIHQKIKEGNKERIQKFKGVVIKTAGKTQLEKTITVRRKVGAFGVEKVFAIHSSTIEKIDVLRQFKVRRKSIKFIRNLTGKAARLKEVPLKQLKQIEIPENSKEEIISQQSPSEKEIITKDIKKEELIESKKDLEENKNGEKIEKEEKTSKE